MPGIESSVCSVIFWCAGAERPWRCLIIQQRVMVAQLSDFTIGTTRGDDRFRHCLRNCEKRAEDAELSRERPPQHIGADAKRTDFALAV